MIDVPRDETPEGYVTGIWSFWDKRPPGALAKGTGKTNAATFFLKKDSDAGYRCFSNYDTTFTERTTTQEVYNMLKDETLWNFAAVLDEIQKDLNSFPGATAPSLIKEFADIAAAQTRKRNIRLYWTSQRALNVPGRVLAQTDYYLQTVRVHNNGKICRRMGCKREHYIAVFSREPELEKPIVYLNPAGVGAMYNTRQVLVDRIEEI